MPEVGDDGVLVESAIQDSIASGLIMGYDIATMVNCLLQIFYWTSHITGFDGWDLLSMQGLLYSFLLVVGALATVAWPLDDETAHHPLRQDEEAGHVMVQLEAYTSPVGGLLKSGQKV
ncbi:MAG: hypothetical protein Q9209_003347 [Squamulea sp. 1 TL-2023]